MNKDLKQWAWDMQRTIDSAIERISSNTLSDRDAVETATMLLQLDHEVRNDPEYHTDTAIPAISVTLNELYDALNSRDIKLLQLDNDVFRQLLSFGGVLITKEEREAQAASKQVEREDGRTYIDFLPRMPHEQYLQIVGNLKEIGAKYDPEIKQWYVDKDWEPKQMNPQSEISGQPVAVKEKHPIISEEKQFKAIYYDDSERKEIFGPTKDDVVDTVRKLKVNAGDKERCYLQEYDGQKYQQEGIYLITSGRDVTPVEIHLPYMHQNTFREVRELMKKMGIKFDVSRKVWYVERGNETFKMDVLQNYLNKHDEAIYLKLPQHITSEQFKEIIGQLKQDGARYNSDKKAWYITDRNNIDKFSAYLPSGSIHTKLEQNKKTVSAVDVPGRDLGMESMR